MACGKSGNIILIGMPSSGKSTVGVILAKTLGKAFIDTDLLIQQREGKTLQEIIDENGNDYFHMVEEAVLLGVEAENTVIATGGSAVYFPDALEKLYRGKSASLYRCVRRPDMEETAIPNELVTALPVPVAERL